MKSTRLPAEIEAEILLRLPTEIEAEILFRLPVKTLIRFKSVCKSWYSLISSPHFHRQHFRLAQRHPLLLTLQRNQTRCSSDLTLRFSTYNNKKSTLTPVHKFTKTLTLTYDNGSGIEKLFTQSCLGFVCIASWSYEAPPILILNPSTGELISLPPVRHSNVCFGFGYTPSTHLFKVVRFFYDDDGGTHCEVFTLGSTHWRAMSSIPYLVSGDTAPFLNGAFHFLPLVWYEVKDTDCVGVFDIETEEYRQGIPLPAYYYNFEDAQDMGATSDDFMNLTNLGGLLCLTFNFGETQGRLELWILRDYHNLEWVKRYNIDISSAFLDPYGLWAYPAENRGDESIVLNLCTKYEVKLMGYDPEDEIVTFKIDEEWASTFYVESLYPLREAWSASGNFSQFQRGLTMVGDQETEFGTSFFMLGI